MIIDCHTHLGPNSDIMAMEKHLDLCDPLAKAIVFPAIGEGLEKANVRLGKYIKQYSKMIGFGAINPLKTKITAKSISGWAKKHGFSGIVLSCSQDKYHPCHSRAMQLYAIAEDLSLPVFFHNSAPLLADACLEYAQPVLIDEVAREFPNLKIIIASMGRPFIEQTTAIINKHENVYAELSVNPDNIWQSYNTVMTAYEANVFDKLFFGSGLPHGKLEKSVETLLGFNRLFTGSQLPTIPREKIAAVVERDTLKILGIEQ